MSDEEILALARKAGFQTGTWHMCDGTEGGKIIHSVGSSCFHEVKKLIELVMAQKHD